MHNAVRAALCAAIFALASIGGAHAETNDLTPQQAERYQKLVNELRCLVCQNQSIADSNAPLAEDLRKQVYHQIKTGRSDAEIADYVTARYGDFVLYRPPFKASTWLLWIGPFALLMLALGIALAFVRRRAQSSPARVADVDKLRRLLDDVAREEKR